MGVYGKSIWGKIRATVACLLQELGSGLQGLKTGEGEWWEIKRIEVVGHLVWGLMGHNEDLGLYPG